MSYPGRSTETVNLTSASAISGAPRYRMGVQEAEEENGSSMSDAKG